MKSRRRWWTEGVLLLILTLVGTSCVVPPGCIDQTFRTSERARPNLVSITLYSEPLGEPAQRESSSDLALWQHFGRGTSITVDAEGRMAVSHLDMWPESCPTMSPADLAEISRAWGPLLGSKTPGEPLRAMGSLGRGGDWRPDGPLLSLSVTSASGTGFGLLWDGRSRLPEELDAAVLETLEVICSNSRRGGKYLSRDLPKEVAERLRCRSD